MKTVLPLVVMGLCIAGISADARAYEILTHQDLTEAAADRSVLTLDPSVLRNLGLEQGVRDQAQTFPNSKGRERRILDLLRDGAEFEDDVVPVLGFTKHFYNPITGEGLNIPKLPTQAASPDWALTGAQEFSYLNARQYFFDALTKPAEADRKRAFGLTFQTLGHVVHHLQDMAQPQHVRNDVHCHSRLCGLLGAYAPSLYERWTDREGVRESLPKAPSLAGYEIASPLFTSTFNSSRRFWHTESPGPSSVTSGKGIAEYANRNFVSAGTNFDFVRPRVFPSPVLDESTRVDMDIQQLCANANPPCLNPKLTGTITFYGNVVEDRLTGQVTNNPFASSLSIFDADLRKTTGTPLSQPLLFTLNRFNFALAHGFLMPRAIAYSAGMINYFFRGKIDIEADPNNPGGYLIKNLGAEAMSGKFALYYDATDGSRKGVRDSAGNPVVWDSRIILASAAGQISPSGGAMPVTGFASPDDAKTPGEYLLVFNGDMGEEKADEANGVMGAVAAKFVSAPGTNGTLYILTRNVFNRLQTLKVDKTGTASATDFDPFGALGSVNGGNIMFKQVAFKQAVGGGWSYQVLAGGFTFPGTNPGFFWDAASKKFVAHTLRRWTAQSPNPAIGKFFFWFTQNSGNVVLNYAREFVDAAGVKRTATGTVSLPVHSNLNFILSQEMGFGRLGVSEDGLHIGDFLGSSTTTQTSGQNVFDSVTENKYYELFITLAETPTAELNLLRTSRDTSSGTSIFKPDSSILLSASSQSHREEQRFIGYFNGSKELYGVTTEIAGSGSGDIAPTQPCFNGSTASAFANWQSSFVQTARFTEGALVYNETCNNSAGPQGTGGRVVRPLTYRSDDAVYATNLISDNNTQLNFRNVPLTPNTNFVGDSSPIGEVFFAMSDLSVIIHEPRPGGMKKIVLPSITISILGAIWL